MAALHALLGLAPQSCELAVCNLAIALILEPGLPELFRDVVVMGGAFHHQGNITSHAEANVWHDPEAAELVLGAGWPVTLVPLDATHPTVVDGASRRSAEAVRARAEAATMSALSRSVLTGHDTAEAIVERVRETFGQRSAALLRRTPSGWVRLAGAGIGYAERPEDGDAQVRVDDEHVLVLRVLSNRQDWLHQL